MPPATYRCINPKVLLFIALFVCAVTFPCHVAKAQDTEAISTERPSVGPSPDVIAPGSLQVETGMAVSFQKSQYTADFPESLIRIGITKRFEGRFQASNASYQPWQAADTKFQTEDIGVSGKILLGGPNPIVPKTAIMNLSLPTGGLQYTSGSYDPSLTLLWAQNITHGWSILEVAQGTLTTLRDARRPIWAPSISVGYPLSDKLSGYVEYAPSLLQDRSFVYILDGGLLLLHNKTRQFDVHAGYLADAGGIHTLIGFGYSVRYDSFFSRSRLPF
jgi:Putative MetA-pathway of phenol degradation